MGKNNGIAKLFHNIFSGTKDQTVASNDKIAELLKTTPEAISAFNKAYEEHMLHEVSDNFFDLNSRQVAAQMNAIDENATVSFNPEQMALNKELQQRIVDELLAQTEIFIYDGKQVSTKTLKALPEAQQLVNNDDINRLPEELRPQLTGTLRKLSLQGPSYPALLFYYDRYLHVKNEKERKDAYNHFRQGLDILDLDEITYNIIGTNRVSIGHWFPQLVEACQGHDFFKIPATTIAKVPLSLLQLTRLDYNMLTKTTLSIVDQWAHTAFALDDEKEYFIKTGTYSSKFDFRNAHVHGAKEVQELGEYLLFIHFQALQMASPLTQPHSIYGVSTTNEWVVREFIPDKENNPQIYKGLPLHTEYRVFVDCDTKQVLTIVPYWDPETMKNRFSKGSDANSIHQKHDYITYSNHEETLMNRYNENKEVVQLQVQAFLPNLHLKGQWSIDIMQNGEDFWLIDMAPAENSAFYDSVPIGLRRPFKENWIPELPSGK